MRENITYKILDFLGNYVGNLSDFIEVFLTSGYGTSMGEFERRQDILEDKRQSRKIKSDELRRFQKLLSKLKSDGFIKQKDENIQISLKGFNKLRLFKKKINKNNYKKESSSELIIVSYDIPEFWRSKRRILRELLIILGFKMVHKSVWVGKVKIPEIFILDLKKMEIDKFVEILKVSKGGTLKQF